MSSYLDLFFMGAAFLLLETKNVVQFALLFGTTWFVNALVFGGILLTVLAAVEVAKRVRFRRPPWLFAPLFISLALAWSAPPDSLLGLAFVPRFATATVLAFAPVFFANLVFAERFRRVGSSTVAFGTNLLGRWSAACWSTPRSSSGTARSWSWPRRCYVAAWAFGRRSLAADESVARDAGEAVGIV